MRERLLDEAAGNPLALLELPAALADLGGDARLPAWLPLTTRLERAFAARVSDLPAPTRTALLVAALNDSPLLSEVLEAVSELGDAGLSVDVLEPAVAARLVEIGDTEFRFCHPLMRTAIRHDASISQRHAAHAALATVLASQPERRVWHRAASVIGPDEQVAGELEAAAARAQRRGGTAVAVSALRRAAALSDGRPRTGRLLNAAELAFELGRQDLVLDLLSEAEPAGCFYPPARWPRPRSARHLPGNPGPGPRSCWSTAPGRIARAGTAWYSGCSGSATPSTCRRTRCAACPATPLT